MSFQTSIDISSNIFCSYDIKRCWIYRIRIMPKMDQEHLLHDLQQAAIELAHKQYAEAVGKSPVTPTKHYEL